MQDEITLVPDNLRLTLGAKLEQNSFTGLEFQPSGRLLWTPHERHSVWGSVARAVRTPSRVEDNGRINLQVLPAGAVGPLPAVVSAFGQQNFRSEELIAYEAGYRFQPKKWLSVDAAAFYNVYDRLRSIEAVSPGEIETSPPSPHILVPLVAGNELFGETYGVELAVTAQATDWWRLYGSYTYLQMQLHTRHGSTDTTSEAAEGQSPHHQFSIRSSMDLPGHFEVDCGLRYVDPLPALDVPSYFTLDARLAWRPNRRWEISVVGQNLWDNRHPESAPSAFIGTQSTEVERAIYGKIAFNF
jgi:iron complex outermembrane receptor protein